MAGPIGERIGGSPPACGRDAMIEAKLWRNPCGLAFRLNYLALHHNVPLYGWVEETVGLSRPEYVVIYSLGLMDGAFACDIAASSGFPAGTMSRAVNRLAAAGLIGRARDPKDRRRAVLTLTTRGRAILEATRPRFVAFERTMLSALSAREQDTLSHLLAKMVAASPAWTADAPSRAEADATPAPHPADEDA